MNRITKEYYNRLRPFLLPRSIPSFVHDSECRRVFSMIKHECRQLATRWTVLSAKGNDVYFKRDSWYFHRNLDMSFQQVYTGRVVIIDGTPVPEVVIKEVTKFRMSLDDRFRRQAERRIEQLQSKSTKKVYFMEDISAGQIKIGVSHNPDRRRQTLEANRGTALMLLGTIDGGYKKEKELHRRFNHLRIFGEWFQDCDELRHSIQAMMR